MCQEPPRYGRYVSDEPPVRVALRVDDVAAATTFYEEFGFVQIGAVPDPNGRVLMAILRRRVHGRGGP